MRMIYINRISTAYLFKYYLHICIHSVRAIIDVGYGSFGRNGDDDDEQNKIIYMF